MDRAANADRKPAPARGDLDTARPSGALSADPYDFDPRSSGAAVGALCGAVVRLVPSTNERYRIPPSVGGTPRPLEIRREAGHGLSRRPKIVRPGGMVPSFED